MLSVFGTTQILFFDQCRVITGGHPEIRYLTFGV